MITPKGQVFLVDFGLAKVLQGNQVTEISARMMTLGYPLSEQYSTSDTDSRTDTYSLAATLYTVLSGVIPEDELARATDNIELTPLRKHNSEISSQTESVIEKALEIVPANRYLTADEFKKSLVLLIKLFIRMKNLTNLSLKFQRLMIHANMLQRLRSKMV